ncbi:hypothetical protein [Candidatus Binatus sp.]|uniref:hypothetical protein n=1 Tax=Candidatus Binatus sp. TaxID=2811406 RepID=UPI003C72ECF0
MAQTATPTSTPTPSLSSCSITPAVCATGAAEPPSPLGISGGNFNSISVDKSGTVTCCTGTLGAVVMDSSGSSLVLGSSHAFARNGKARVNEEIVQPGLPDLGCWQDPTDTVATLSESSSINFKKGINQFDVALAKIVTTAPNPGGTPTAGIDLTGYIQNVGEIDTTPFPFDSLFDGLPVMKMGRGSCLTQGVIEAWDAAGVVVYPATCNAPGGTALFDHQLLVFGEVPGQTSSAGCSFATLSDSGALVTTRDFTCPQAIGMVFAGSSGTSPDTGGEVVAINPMVSGPDGEVGILEKFKVSLVGQVCTPSPLDVEMGGSSQPYHMSEAMRASVEEVRKIKEAHAHNLLKNSAISAVGIGGGDSPDTAALKVYLSEDTPEIRAEVLREVGNAKVKFRHAARFSAL